MIVSHNFIVSPEAFNNCITSETSKKITRLACGAKSRKSA